MKKSLQKFKKKFFTLQNFFYHKKNNFWGGEFENLPSRAKLLLYFYNSQKFSKRSALPKSHMELLLHKAKLDFPPFLYIHQPKD